MTSRRSVDKSQLGQLSLLGDGGQGKVYTCGRSPLLYKEYLSPSKVRSDRLEALTQTVEAMPARDAARLQAVSAFPRQLVTDGGAFSGFLMAPAPDQFWAHIGGARRLRELQYLTFPQRKAWADLPLPAFQARRHFLVECALLFGLVHSAGLVIGDVSMRNLLWSEDAATPVFLLDCDSMRQNGHEAAVPPAYTPDWDDPLDPLGNTLDSDRYKLALVVLRVLSQLPSARPESVDLDAVTAGWPEGLRLLLEQVATATAGARPLADRWVEALEGRGRIQLATLGAPAQRTTRIEPASRPAIALRPTGTT